MTRREKAMKLAAAKETANDRTRIYNVLRAATRDHKSEVQLTVPGRSLRTRQTLYVGRKDKVHTVKIKLSWQKDHYIGRFVDDDGKQSHAILSLYNQFDAAQFVVAMNLLVDLRARVKHEEATQ
jgi:hypothetical protein